jgi:trehalose/maltose hydrolase-like predicted phosphorylase
MNSRTDAPQNQGRFHTNSLAAYRSILESLPTRQADVLAAVIHLNRRFGAVTDRQVDYFMERGDTAYTVSIITELIDAGKLVDAGNCHCGFTGRSVRMVMVAEGVSE